MIEFKTGVKPDKLNPPILIALIYVDVVFNDEGVNTIVTSTTGDNHTFYSAHYRGDAVDLRSRHLKPERREIVLEKLKEILGPYYLVLLENPDEEWNQHFHVQFRPTKGYMAV